MVQISWLGLITLLACLLPACVLSDGPFGVKIDIERMILPNGLVVIAVEDHFFPVVSYQTWVRVGSVDEKPGRTGMSHLVEHLVFKKITNIGDQDLFQQLEAKGVEANAYTSRDYTVYYENFSAELLPQVIEMEASRLSDSGFSEEALKTERLIILEEKRMGQENTQDGRMQEVLWALSFREHSYSWPVTGYSEDLFNITLKDVSDYYSAYYAPSNVAIIAVGDFKKDVLFDLIKKQYASISKGQKISRDIPSESEQVAERRIELNDVVESESFKHAYHITPASDRDSYALDVLSNVLFLGSSSRAYKDLVSEKHLVTQISGTSYTPSFPGLFIISVTMEKGVPASRAEKELDKIIKEVAEKGLTSTEIDTAVKQLKLEIISGLRTAYGLGQLVGTVQTVFGDPEALAKDLKKYMEVSTEDIKRVAGEYLYPNNRTAVILKPHKAGKNK